MKFLANLKSNHTRASFKEYADILNANLKDEEVMVFPPASAFLKGDYKFKIGAQNFYPAQNGSFTGEITRDMLDEFDISSVIIGHSERRLILGEDDSFIKLKFDYAKDNGWEIIYCVGESNIVRMNGSTKSFLKSQLESIDLNYDKLIIAYEPIWAIGSGNSAKISDIDEILSFIKELSDAPLLYGGSVNVKNIKDIAKVKDCSGVLVGTASFEADNFLKLIKEVKCC